MIHSNGKEVVAIHTKGKVISAVYKGAKHVWQAVRSCFGSGHWVNAKAWVNQEAWRNN